MNSDSPRRRGRGRWLPSLRSREKVRQAAGSELPGPDTLARALAGRLSPPEPDRAFVEALRRRLDVEAGRMIATVSTARSRRPRRSMPTRPVLAALAVMGAAAVLAFVFGAVRLRDNSRALGAVEVLDRAKAASDSSEASFRTFVVTERSEINPAGAPAGEQVRGEISRWYAGPNRWRREVSATVVGTDGRTVSRTGLTSVSDGATVWLHRQRDNVVMARPYEVAANPGELGPFPEVTGGLSSLLEQVARCYTPHLRGSDTVAGRASYVVALGPPRCPVATATATAPPESSEWTLWVDKQTFLILKSVQDIGGRAIATTTVTSIRYDVSIDPARFAFTPPPGARVRDARPAPPAGSPLVVPPP